MKKVIASLAALTFVLSSASAQGFNTTGGYGSPVLDSRGAAYINTDGLKPTYAYQGKDLGAYASATDYIVLTGSATKTIRINQVCYGADATAASIQDFYVYKRTVADTGGTSTAGAIAQYDSQDPAPTATISIYSVAPTLGAGVLVRGGHVNIPNATTPVGQAGWVCWAFGIGTERLVIRGVAEQLAINHNGSIATGMSGYYTIEFTEE